MCKRILVAVLLVCMMLSLIGCAFLEGQETCGGYGYNDRWEDDDRFYDYERWDKL